MEYILVTIGVGLLIYALLKYKKKASNPPGVGGGDSGNTNQPK